MTESWIINIKLSFPVSPTKKAVSSSMYTFFSLSKKRAQIKSKQNPYGAAITTSMLQKKSCKAKSLLIQFPQQKVCNFFLSEIDCNFMKLYYILKSSFFKKKF